LDNYVPAPPFSGHWKEIAHVSCYNDGAILENPTSFIEDLSFLEDNTFAFRWSDDPKEYTGTYENSTVNYASKEYLITRLRFNQSGLCDYTVTIEDPDKSMLLSGNRFGDQCLFSYMNPYKYQEIYCGHRFEKIIE